MSRRVWTCFFICCCAVLLFSFQPLVKGNPVSQQATAAASQLVYFGTYTDTGSKGIYAYRINLDSNQFDSIGLVAELAGPAWVTVHPNHQFLKELRIPAKM
jgi:hypothetical protein